MLFPDLETTARFASVISCLIAFATLVINNYRWLAEKATQMKVLLGNALIPLFDCLFGMLLLTIKPTPLSMWRWCSGFSLLLSFPFGFSTWRRLSELGPTVIKNMGAYRYLFYMVGILGTAVVLSQFYNALVSGVFWLFYAAVIFPLAIGTLQFALMILLPPHISET